jgi:hypothetical protein
MIQQGFNRKEKTKFKLSYARPWEYALSAAVVPDCYSGGLSFVGEQNVATHLRQC